MKTIPNLEDYEVEWINSESRLTEIAEQWNNITCLAIDTEFERRTTFYAKLALVQILDGEKIYLIDPLKINCPPPLKDILENQDITKIFHSCKEDLEVLYTSWNCKLQGLFDTQVAYSFLTGELSIGYAKLVEQQFNIPVDKKETTSDWIKRPLTEKQMNYAAKDVLYLIEIYDEQLAGLQKKTNKELFERECKELCSNANESIERLPSYQMAKDVWRLNDKQVGLFKRLFDWRENEARQKDITKNHIIKDHELVELASICPSNINQIKSIKTIHPRSIRKYADKWLALIALWIKEGSPTSQTIVNPRDVSGLKEMSTKLEKVVTKIAKENHLNSTLLLSKRISRKLAQAHLTSKELPEQWKGWRKDLLATHFDKILLEK